MTAFSMSERSEIVRSRTSTIRTGEREADDTVDVVLFDLLMAVMDSLAVWSLAAHDTRRGLRWRDAVTARVQDLPRYFPYEDLVAEAAVEEGLPPTAARELLEGWPDMEPWPDAAALARLTMPYGFVTNCSADLARTAARRSGLAPRFVLSAEEAGAYKPNASIYLEACGRLGTAPERTLFVAGSPYDAAGAQRAGLRAVLVNRRPDVPLPAAAIPTATSLHEVVAWIEGARCPR